MSKLTCNSIVRDAGGGSARTRIGASTIVEVDYDEPGVSWSLINGTGADPYTGLDQFNRVADSRWFKDTTDLDRIKHGYDLAGNRLYRKNTVAEATSVHLDELYQFDGLYRINQFDRGTLNSTNTAITSGTLNYTQDWGLDSTGNWRQFIDQDHGAPSTIDQSRSANTINEITGITGGGWAVPSYDAVGNMTNVPLPVDMTSGGTAVYDAWNRLVSLAGGDVSSTSRYDGLGRRISHLGSEAWTERYFSDNWQVLDEGEEVDSPARQRFVWGLRYIDDLILRQRGNQRLYALQDPNWNVTSVCDPFGTVKERYTYLAYGQPTFRNASFDAIAESAYQWETLFAGYRWDSESGLYYVRNRYLNAWLGNWLTRDPMSYNGGMNLYDYVSDMPISSFDAYGLQPRTERMHWFMKLWRSGKGQQLVNRHCKCPHIDINRYTTEYTVEEHRWIHRWHGYEVGVRYEDLYKTILEKSKNCCDFLKQMLAMMLAWDTLVRMAGQAGLISDVSNKAFDLIKYTTTVNPPVSQLPDYLARLHLVCGSSKKQKELTLKNVERRTNEIVTRVKNFEQLDQTPSEELFDFIYVTLRTPALAPVPVAAPARVPQLVPKLMPQLVH